MITDAEAVRAEEARGACPYLRSAAGYRLGHSSREHVCDAIGPHARIRGDKQTSLCLSGRHTDCQTYLTAQSLDARRPELIAERRHWTTTIPTVVAGAPISASAPAVGVPHVAVPSAVLRIGRSQRLYAVTVAVLMLLAVALVLYARVLPMLSASGSTPTPAPSQSVPVVQATTSPNVGATTPASVSPLPSPSTTRAAPSATVHARTYVVQPGDTVQKIARQFNTTRAALQAANGIEDPTKLPIGRVLIIP